MNILVIIVAIMLIVNIGLGYRRGMVRQFVTLVTLIIMGLVTALIAAGLKSYINGQFLNVLFVILLLSVIGIVRHALDLVFFAPKIITKLPIIKGIDRILGIFFGVIEMVLILWTVYTFVMMLDMGMVGNMIKTYTSENSVLSWLYENNYLAFWIQKMTANFSV